jgi:hypothetical protein
MLNVIVSALEKMALLVLRRVGLCVGQNQMCHLCVVYFFTLTDSVLPHRPSAGIQRYFAEIKNQTIR